MCGNTKTEQRVRITEIKSESLNASVMKRLCQRLEGIHVLRTAIGYILHRHREESKAKAVILVDEELTTLLSRKEEPARAFSKELESSANCLK